MGDLKFNIKSASFDEKTRVFHGWIDWRDTDKAHKYKSWEFCLTFSEDYVVIQKGVRIDRDADDKIIFTQDYDNLFAAKLFYNEEIYNNILKENMDKVMEDFKTSPEWL